ncbi:aromatic ring-hydroxylating dioxygenase subunit alpha [Rhizobiaceae bacterium n13]|uniref:Aromatic ring-hydroxylating dioxygenase subunit alpha n=1 Tax=Ferirhizobium litorale TaxID=2927786 RepID=A0AAE3QCW7_9HYPH|nr:aromatic ring-hydroxylating dioxygenase subunit alpha [Fererhizobium litorale]MDI7862121.1 aromatic ring-hydroxylating dioxygenase subunit alpha [Fererhizobium litorale]MDI7922606.1 aromatic ring-hydroxylating dioxygenase subunit alpha [Fererhizobium litorale]
MNITAPPPVTELQASLPSSWYLEDRIFELEKKKIFFNEWICVGRVEEVDEAGGHKVYDVFGQSVLVVRNREGNLKAFYNVCRHRGAELCVNAGRENRPGRAEIKGGVVGRNLIRCAYHSWAYNFDGALVAAPHLGEEISKEKFSLHPVGADSWAGFLFLHLTPAGAPKLSEQLGAMPQRISRYPLAELRAGAALHYEVEANWKVIAENYNECYHCAGVHPELCAVVPAFRENGGAGLDWDKGVPHREGAHTFTATGTTHRRPFPGLDPEEFDHHKGELVYPNLFVSLSSDHAACFLLTPKGPCLTRVDCIFLFEQQEIEKPGFDPSDAVEFWDLVNRQDWSVCERVQRGMTSRVHDFGYYAPMEDLSLDIRRYVTSRLGPDAGSSTPKEGS